MTFFCTQSINKLCQSVPVYFTGVPIIHYFLQGAVTLFPPSYAACNEESVMFTCSATTQFSIRWTITSPMMQYQLLALSQRDVGIMPLPTRGDFTFNVTSYTPSTMKLETTGTVTASEDLNGLCWSVTQSYQEIQ